MKQTEPKNICFEGQFTHATPIIAHYWFNMYNSFTVSIVKNTINNTKKTFQKYLYKTKFYWCKYYNSEHNILQGKSFVMF